MHIEIKIKGVRETMDNIIEMGDETEQQLSLAMAKVVFKVTQTARDNAPVKTGKLRHNIVPFPAVKLRRRSGVVGYVSSLVKYSLVQEFGRPPQAKKPRFLSRAVESNRNFIRETLKDSLRGIVLTANGGKG